MSTALPHQIRIIGGQWKRTVLPVPVLAGLRPTPDRVRETLFNWLGQTLHGKHCLDLFAGTGALGVEAASRGAAMVWLNDSAPQAVRALTRVCEKLHATQMTVSQREALPLLQQLTQQGKRFDLIFLDPPFDSGCLEKIFPYLPAVLSVQGQLYVEAEAPLASDLFREHFVLQKQGKAGAVYYHLLRYGHDGKSAN